MKIDVLELRSPWFTAVTGMDLSVWALGWVCYATVFKSLSSTTAVEFIGIVTGVGALASHADVGLAFTVN